MFWDLSKRNMLKIGIDINILKTILKYSFPLMPHTIAYNVSDYVTKVVISEHLTLSVLGVYSLSAQFGNVADVVLNSIQSAFQPWMFNILKEKQNSAKSALANVTYLLLWLYGVFFISIALFSKEVILFMVNDGYQNAWRYVSAIVVVIALKAPSYFYMNFLYYDINKTKYFLSNSYRKHCQYCNNNCRCSYLGNLGIYSGGFCFHGITNVCLNFSCSR